MNTSQFRFLGQFGLAALCMLVVSSCGQKKDYSIAQSVSGGNSVVDGKDAGRNAKTSSTSAASGEITVPIVPVQSKKLCHLLDLPGELKAYQDVAVHAKVEGFISWIGVDRGSILHKGARMMTIYCPELEEKTREAESKQSSAVSDYRRSQAAVEAQRANLVEVQAKLDADQLTLSRLRQAAQTPGAIAQNEIDMQQKTVEADTARVNSVNNEIKAALAVAQAEKANVQAAKNIVGAQKDMKAYLVLTAPFDGVITERNVHQGSIVAVDPTRNSAPLVRIQERDLLRLVVAVPEASVAGLKLGQDMAFSVPAFLGKTFYGKVARLGYALDESTRTMPVELNVWNRNSELEPGMFATVHWTVSRPYNTLFVPTSAVGTDLKDTFVNVVHGDIVDHVTVQKGQSMGDFMEIVGNIKEGDMVTLKAGDDLRSGSRLIAKAATADEIKDANKHAASTGE